MDSQASLAEPIESRAQYNDGQWIGEDVLIPRGQYLRLGDRGRCFYREYPNPGKPVLVLLHGMVSSALLNWHRCFHHLAPHFHIVAPDLRGHGRSFRKSRSFRISSCARDINGLLEALDLEKVILVGYSMGGAIAQYLVRHYPERIGGMVLSAAGYQPRVKPGQEILAVPLLSAVVGAAHLGALLTRAPRRMVTSLLPVMNYKEAEYQSLRTSLIDEMRRTSLRHTLAAGREMALHNASEWLPDMNLPSAVVVTSDDGVFPCEQQERMAQLLPDCRVIEFAGNHRACTHTLYGHTLADACNDVAERMKGSRQ